MSQNVNYVYICSSGHSGSTLLDLLLGSHSKISSLGEVIQLPKNLSLNTICTCGEPVRSCPFWKKVVSNIGLQLGIDLLQNPYALNLGFANPLIIKDKIHHSRRYHLKRIYFKGLWYFQLKYNLHFLKIFINPIYTGIKNTLKVYDTIQKITSCNIIVDSSKAYLEAIGLYLSRPERVRIIFLTRDGRGVFYSYLKRNFKPISLNNWKTHYSRAIPLIKRHIKPEHLFSLKYENLATNTDFELNRLCKFLNIDFESGMLNFAEHVHHITNGNNMRFNKNSLIKYDDTWKSALSPDELSYFNNRAGKLNRKLGYE